MITKDSGSHKPYWPRTLQLLPVHLQAGDAYAEDLVSRRLGLVSDFGYGMRRLSVDETALGRGDVVLKRVAAVFPSGVYYENGDVPLRRNVSASLGGTLGPVALFLGLPRVAIRGPNVAVEDGRDRSMRYTAKRDADPPWMSPRPEILLESEELDRYERILLGRVQRIGNALRLDKAVLPTIVRIRASRDLEEATKRLVASLKKRRDALIAYRKDHPLNLKAVDPGELPGLELLSIVQRFLPVLEELAGRRSAHPRELYEAASALYGSLLVFGAEEAPPPYVHERLGEVFPPLFERIQRVVDEAARDRTTILVFKRAGEATFRLSYKREDLVGKRPFLVASGADETFLRERLPNLLKMASPVGMQPLLQSALRGVAIAVEFEPPAVIPRRQDVAAYRINVRDALWLDIEDRTEIELYLPHAPREVEFRLYGVERVV